MAALRRYETSACTSSRARCSALSAPAGPAKAPWCNASICWNAPITARAELVLAGQVAVHRADREGRRDGQVRQAEAAQRGAYQSLAGLGGGNPFGHVQVQHGAAGVLALQRVLQFQRLEGVVGKAHR